MGDFAAEQVRTAEAAGPRDRAPAGRQSTALTRLQRGVGNQGTQRILQGSAPTLKAGDDIVVVVYANPTDTAPQPRFSRTYRLDASGAIAVGGSRDAVPVDVHGLSPQDAAQRIADRLVEAELFRGPRVCVTGPGMTAPACADAKTAMRPDTSIAYDNFVAYIRPFTQPADAIQRYHQWIEDHRDTPEFTRTTPAELWAQSQRPAEQAGESEAQRWSRFMKDRLALDAKLPAPERAPAAQTMRRFQDWYDKHHRDPDFAKADPATVYADIAIAVIKGEVEAAVMQKVAANARAAADSPEVWRARGAKFDEFFALGRKLWGYSARRFPYSIPIDSEGKDILVTGDPALQAVLDALAADLTRWAGEHLADPDFLRSSAERVLTDLLHDGYADLIALARTRPEQHETIDRHEILARTALAAFGESVGTVLLTVALVGAFVGANIITGGTATVLLLGLGAYGGVRSYLDRREEIENSGYNVSVPESMLDSVGDVVGASQLIEGLTGQRLGTGRPLSSVERSNQLGAGAGNVATIFLGSRAYRAGEALGQRVRLNRRALGPGGPEPDAGSGGTNRNLPVLDPAPRVRTVAPGVIEVYQLGRPGLVRITEHGWEVFARAGDSRPILAERWVEGQHPPVSPELLKQAPVLADVRAVAKVSLGGRLFGVGVTAEGWFVYSPGTGTPVLSGRFGPRVSRTPLLSAPTPTTTLTGRPRSTVFVPGLTSSPDFAADTIGELRITGPRIPSDVDDLADVELRITAIGSDGARGSVVRRWNRATNTFTYVEADLTGLPKFVPTTPELVPGEGTPLEAYLTLRLMNAFMRLGADFSGAREVRLENITNVPAVAQLAEALMKDKNVSMDVALRQTKTVQYAENAIIQSGGRITNARIEGGELIRWDVFAKNENLSRLPQLPPDLLVRWKYRVILTVEPAAGGR
ncbi:hypothetical protein [Dactylosporangium sp. NPDC051541]|uniref:hypothetical protein n=1 Tax=Dactylosporangium sp. NPDC051541 TaxID=3363977 RepID=UPI0037BA7C57